MPDRIKAKVVKTSERPWRCTATCEAGQTLVEYALILTTVAIGVITAIVFLKGELDDVWTAITQAI